VAHIGEDSESKTEEGESSEERRRDEMDALIGLILEDSERRPTQRKAKRPAEGYGTPNSREGGSEC